ncbi:MAG: YscO family type III secretion system apparatus protein [Pseudomonadota bacterium]
MIGEIDMLCRVKDLHKHNRLRALQLKKAAVNAAAQEEAAHQRVVTESRDALPCLEAALYDEIMHVTVMVSDVDETKAKVLKAQKDHQKLEDEAERLTQIRMRCEQERDEARAKYQMAQRDTEKFMTIQEEYAAEQARAVEAQEDAESEEFFMKARGIIE